MSLNSWTWAAALGQGGLPGHRSLGGGVQCSVALLVSILLLLLLHILQVSGGPTQLLLSPGV